MDRLFDKIVCINLPEDKIRKNNIIKFSHKTKFPIQFYHPVRDKENGRRGCFNSHMNVIETAYREGCNTLCVFEDDIYCNNNYSEKHMSRISSCLKTYPDHMLMIGWSVFPWTNKIRISKHLFKSSAWGGYAYCMTKLIMKKILQYRNFRGIPIDKIYMHEIPQLLYYPSQFWVRQEDSKTSSVSNFFSSVCSDRGRIYWLMTRGFVYIQELVIVFILLATIYFSHTLP